MAATATAWWTGGSIASHSWLPLSLVVAGVLAVAVAAGAVSSPGRRLLASPLLLALLAAWTAVTIAWSPSPSGARDEALLVATYALALLVPLLTGGSETGRLQAIGAIVAVVGVTGALTAAKFATAAHPRLLLFAGRLDFPISYVNGTAALFALAVWPALALAGRRQAGLALRSASLGTAALLLALVAAAQSKGAVLGLAVATALLLLLAPSRLRLLPLALLAVVPVAAALGPLTAPYRSTTAEAARLPGWWALALGCLGALLGAVFVLADRRLSVSETVRRTLERSLALLVVGALAAGLAVISLGPGIGGEARRAWHSLEQSPSRSGGSSHLVALGSHRIDFWRVALDEARAHPVLGIGGRGFYNAYLLRRRSPETPLRAHSLYLDTLAEEGIPGLVLLLLALGLPLAAAARRLRSPVGIAAFGGATTFLVHAAVDWVWTIPAVGVPALLLLGAGCVGAPRARFSRRAELAVVAVAVALAVFVFAPPWLSYRYVAASYTSSDPGHDLAIARRLDPLSLEPDLAAWRLASTPTAGAAALEAAHRMEPADVAVLYQLGLADLRAGKRAAAAAALRDALRRDPREPAIRAALRRAGS